MAHNCFDRQIHHEPCPFCGSNENVFIGHGDTRHCATCVMNWALGERFEAKATKADTVQNKVQSLPNDIKRRVNETRQGLRQASGLEARLRRLRNISQAEWDKAENAS